MSTTPPFVDIHCHLIPEIDDGAKSSQESLDMARMAAADGIQTIIATPHQLGSYADNSGKTIRQRTAELQSFLRQHAVELEVLPGADVRIDDTMFAGLRAGNVVTLGDHRKHVLLELPHEMYLPTQPILEQLEPLGMTAVLSHPERNKGLLRQPQLVTELVRQGCLMQVTGSSLLGTFGLQCRHFVEWMLANNLVHFMATDAHGPKNRRPLLRRCFERVKELSGAGTAELLCCHNPDAVARGQEVESHVVSRPTQGKSRWFGRRKSA